METNIDNTNTQKENCQEYLTRISRKGYQSPLIDPDDSPITLQEHLQLILSDIDEASPHKPLGELIVKSLNALIDIAESLNAQPDYSDQLDRVIELWQETNRLLRDIKESHEATADRNRPPLPPMPGSQGGRKFRAREIDESPGVKRLRESEKGGG